MATLLSDFGSEQTRRQFFGQSRITLGTAALAMLAGSESAGSETRAGGPLGGLAGLPHFRRRAKRVIFLFQSGGPSQMDLLDYKPKLKELHGTELPDAVRRGQRLTMFTARQKSKPIVSPPRKPEVMR